MVQINVSTDIARLTSHLREIERKQIPFATAMALTATAKAAQADVRAALPSIFAHPNQYTLNSMYVQKASKSRLEADVHIKDRQARYLAPQILGGPRTQKPFEWRLMNAGIGTTGYFAPAYGADFLSNGVMNPGQLGKIMSDFNALDDVAKKGLFSRNRGKRKDEQYFVVNARNEPYKRGNGLRPGIYKRVGRDAIPVMWFIPRPTYKPIFPFRDLTSTSMQRHFPATFRKALNQALGTARKGG